jgi:hypothetical protein
MLHEVACMEVSDIKAYLIAEALAIHWSKQSPSKNKWVIKQVHQFNHETRVNTNELIQYDTRKKNLKPT